MLKTRLLVLVAVALASVVFLSAGATALAAFIPENFGRSQVAPALQGTPQPGDDQDQEDQDQPDQEAGDENENPDKVVNAIAVYFAVSPDEIRARHTAGLGFGEIARAYQLAKASGQAVDAILAQRAAGQGWGELYRAYDLNPGGGGLGAILGGGHGRPEKPGKPSKP
jgi:hypothetical protein